MLIQEISFREWVICKIRSRSVSPAVPVLVNVCEHVRRPKVFHARLTGDRRNEAEGEGFASKERRRRPERRIPEVGEVSFDEFERWKNRLNLR